MTDALEGRIPDPEEQVYQAFEEAVLEVATAAEHDVVAGLAYMAAERCLKSLELAADLHGVGTHIFPSVGNEEPHALTVTYCTEFEFDPHYDYRFRVPSCPSAGGVIDRETALKHLATDKQIRALQ